MKSLLEGLLSMAAGAVIRRPVEVRFSDLRAERAGFNLYGRFYHDGAKGYVELDDSYPNWWFTFLHELAHARLHWPAMPAATAADLAAAKNQVGRIMHDLEGEADALAEYWRQRVAGHKYSASGDIGRCLALAEMAANGEL